MRLLKCQVQNFGSYESLEFDFDSQGLALVQGATGSGKSTLFDIPTWALFGITAKNGTVDEVRSWSAPDSPTKVVLRVETPDLNTIEVTRVRGTTGQNDLFWYEDEGTPPKRGKDLAETQKLLNQRLGVDDELYLSSAYFCEFSPTYGFFSANAKGRRGLFEKVADLSLPVRLAERTAKVKKDLTKQVAETGKKVAAAQASAQSDYESYQSSGEYFNSWAESHEKQLHELQICSNNFELEKTSTIDALVTKHDRFEADREKRMDSVASKAIDLEEKIKPFAELADEALALEATLMRGADRCSECGAPKNHAQREEFQGKLSRLKVKLAKLQGDKDVLERLIVQLAQINDETNPYPDQIASAKKLQNTYAAKREELSKQINPHEAQMDKFFKRWEEKQTETEKLESALSALNQELLTMQQLNDLSLVLRGELLKKAVGEAERRTNTALETYFDSELRVKFLLEGADNLDVSIYKSGFQCTYRQLSKGQRSLLRLCFSVSIMQMASDQSGVHFGQLFFDEPTDGCDVALKQKAFGLLERLGSQHDSVFVIEHSTELKSSFTKAFNVTLTGDVSQIEEQN